MESPLLRAGVAAAQNALRMLPNANVKTEEVKSEEKVKVEVKKEFSPAVLNLNVQYVFFAVIFNPMLIFITMILGRDLAIQGKERGECSCQEKED